MKNGASYFQSSQQELNLLYILCKCWLDAQTIELQELLLSWVPQLGVLVAQWELELWKPFQLFLQSLPSNYHYQKRSVYALAMLVFLLRISRMYVKWTNNKNIIIIIIIYYYYTTNQMQF